MNLCSIRVSWLPLHEAFLLFLIALKNKNGADKMSAPKNSRLETTDSELLAVDCRLVTDSCPK